MRKVKWGVLGAAKIAVTRVIPAMQLGDCCEIVGIASRDREKAGKAARELGIPKTYGSYEEMLADPEIEAVYNPLPNHLHVPWPGRAAEAGLLRDSGHRVAGPGESRESGARAGDSENVRVVRGDAGGPGDRGGLQSAAEPLACAVAGARGGGGTAAR